MELKLYHKDNALNNINPLRDVAYLFQYYFQEVHKDDFIGNLRTIEDMITANLFEENKSLYVLYDGIHPIGFILLYINDQYGNTTPILVNDYMYVKPEYRGGKAVAMLYGMVAAAAEDNEMDVLGTTFTFSSNDNNNNLVGGEVIANVFRFRLDDFKNRLQTYKKRIFNV